MRRLAVAAGVIATSLAFAGGVAPAAQVRYHYVDMGSNFYDPSDITIKQGEGILFSWVPSSKQHNVAVKKGPEKFQSPTLSAGRWSRVFKVPGKFRLYCTRHTMKMTLTVKPRPQ